MTGSPKKNGVQGTAKLANETGVIIPIHKKEDKGECTNYREIPLPSLSRKLHIKCLEKRCREMVEPSWRTPRAVIGPVVVLQRRDRPIYRPGQYYRPIFGFYRHIGISQNGLSRC